LHPDRHEELKKRVVSAAEAALAHHQYVSAIDVLTGTGLLAATHVESWRKGRIEFLERAIQANLEKISQSMAMFRQWALKKGLKPSETHYVRRTRTGTVDLQFSKSGDPAIERNYRTHYVSPSLSERKQERLAQKLSSPAQPVVFEILRDSACSECGDELPQGSLLLMEAEQTLCLLARPPAWAVAAGSSGPHADVRQHRLSVIDILSTMRCLSVTTRRDFTSASCPSAKVSTACCHGLGLTTGHPALHSRLRALPLAPETFRGGGAHIRPHAVAESIR